MKSNNTRRWLALSALMLFGTASAVYADEKYCEADCEWGYLEVWCPDEGQIAVCGCDEGMPWGYCGN